MRDYWVWAAGKSKPEDEEFHKKNILYQCYRNAPVYFITLLVLDFILVAAAVFLCVNGHETQFAGALFLVSAAVGCGNLAVTLPYIGRATSTKQWTAFNAFLLMSLYLYPFQTSLIAVLAIIPTMWYHIHRMKMWRKSRDAVKAYTAKRAEEEEEFSRQAYEYWKNQKEYQHQHQNENQNAYEENQTPAESEEDRQAKRLFEGYTDSPEKLKARYRQLIKKYHPDVGGDVKMMQSIIRTYEAIK